MAACRLNHWINMARLAQSLGMICTAAGTLVRSRGAAQAVSRATDAAIAINFIVNPGVGVWDDDGIQFWHVPHEHGTASPGQTGPGVDVAWVQ